MKDLFNYKYILEQNRFPWIDYAKGICIILVCYRHSFEGLINANFPTGNYPFLELINSSLVTFRMALFFIISGLFISRTLAKKSYGAYFIDRFKVIIYPLLIWGSVQITLQLVFKNYTNAQRTPFDYVNLLIMPRKIEQFWYLNALFMVGVLYAFFKSVLKFTMAQLMVSALLLYALGFVYYFTGANMRYETLAYSFIPDLLHYYIFFFIGDAIAPFIWKKENIKYLSSLKILIPIALFFFLAHYYYTYENSVHHKGYYVEFYMPASFLVIALSGCALTVLLSFILQRFNVLKFLRVIGFHSLYIYLMHVIFTGSVRVLVTKLLHINNIPVLLLFSVITGVTLPILIYNFLIKNGMWWCFTLQKPQKKYDVNRELSP
jgi:fucose 4-O-acetylase-like acetyltransferase